MQGRLRNELISVDIETKCKHCDQNLHLMIDSKMQASVQEKDAHPLVFMPDVNWDGFAERTIIDSY